jgi:hypothetical protein
MSKRIVVGHTVCSFYVSMSTRIVVNHTVCSYYVSMSKRIVVGHTVCSYYVSSNVQGSIKLSFMVHRNHEIFMVQKDNMLKKKVFAARNLKRLDQVYHSK